MDNAQGQCGSQIKGICVKDVYPCGNIVPNEMSTEVNNSQNNSLAQMSQGYYHASMRLSIASGLLTEKCAHLK